MRALPYCGALVAIAVFITAAALAQNSAAQPEPAVPAQGAAGTNEINCGRFAASDPSLELISKLCDFALTYRDKLPDFIAQQTTTSHGPHSTVVMTAQVTYHKGLEQRSQVTINGNPVPPKGRVNVDLRLLTSGEFGPLLINLFEVPDTIEFTFRKTDALLGARVALFDFHLPKSKNTFWAIRDPKGESLKPEFRGHLWLELQTGRIVREEVEPIVDERQTWIASLKLYTDYSMTKVSDLGTFLLPVKSESRMCLGSWQSSGCTTNTVVFHDYQKFVATSRILPADSGP